jgi:DNA repair exonuclease SbcCD ATPase subunit
MNSTPNTKDVLIARADEQLARVYEQIARADEQIARVSEQFSKIERDAAHDPSVGSAAQPPRWRPARSGLIGLLSAMCVVGIVVAFVLQSSHGGVMLIGGQRAPQLISTPSLPPKNPPFPAQPDPSPVQVTGAEAAPPQAAPLSPTGTQDPATAATAASELTQLLQKMTSDIAKLEQAMEELKAKQDQIASENAKAIEQIKTKQEDIARLLARVSEQSALPKTPSPSAGLTQSPQAGMRPRAPPPRRQYPPRWLYYDDEW